MSENTRKDRAEPADAAEENATADETAGEATRFTVDPVTRVSGGVRRFRPVLARVF